MELFFAGKIKSTQVGFEPEILKFSALSHGINSPKVDWSFADWSLSIPAKSD
jgi:hypothetical protein